MKEASPSGESLQQGGVVEPEQPHSLEEPPSSFLAGEGFLASVLRQSVMLRAIYVFLFVRLSAGGRVSFMLLFLFGLGGASSLSIPLYLPWSFFFILMLTAVFSATLLVPRRRSLRVERLPVANGTVGKELAYDVEIENLTRHGLYQLELTEWMLPFHVLHVPGEAIVWVGDLAPGEKRRVRLRMLGLKRGAYKLSAVGVLSGFPLGLWRGLHRHKQVASFLIYPAFQRLGSFSVPSGRQYQPGGILLSSEIGESSEFMHTREYREGDNPRHIHWASWARRGEPVIKVFQEEYFVRLALLLDSERGKGFQEPAFEAGISLAASIADALSRQDYIIDLFAAGDEIHHFQAGRSLAHLENILEILACISPAARIDWSELSATLAPRVAEFTAIVLVLLDWDEARQELVERLRMMGLSVRVFVMREAETTLAFPSAGGDFVKLSPKESLTKISW